MKQNTSKTVRRVKPPTAKGPLDVHDFEQFATHEAINLEHLTIPGFLRRIPHRWHLDEFTRFGDKVGRAAEAMQMSYLTTVDSVLGVVRVFPLPFLERVYAIMSPQFKWPQLQDVVAIEDGKRAERDLLKKQERLTSELQELISSTDEPVIVEAASTLVASLSQSAAALKASIDLPTAPAGS